MSNLQSLPVAIIGAGPVGLAAAAHLVKRNHPFILFEAGNTVAANVLSWGHVRVFSPWRYNIDKASKALLTQSGWQEPDEDGLPTGEELYDGYFKPLWQLPVMKENTFLGARVISIGRKGVDKMKTSGRHDAPFVIEVRINDEIKIFEAKAVIDSSGTWASPNPVGSGGYSAVGESQNQGRIYYGIPDIQKLRARYKNKNVLVVGGGHSSINAILELNKLKYEFPETTIHWVLRKKNIADVFGGQENDALEARGALGAMIRKLVEDDRVNVYTPFLIQSLVKKGDTIMVVGLQDGHQFALPEIDEIISNTGSRPDFSFLREVRLNIDPSLESVAGIAELIDPNIHSCGTVRAHGEKELRHPDPGFYIVGSKSYGRAPTFLMATGYEQVRSVVAEICGDHEAARNVELDLPETGVCSAGPGSSGCCGVEANPKNQVKEVCC